MANTRPTKSPGTGTEWRSPLNNPEKANAEIEAALNSVTKSEMPVIDLPSDDIVTLPGGLIIKDTIIKTVQVKELTGEDEESLARASQSMNAFVFMDRLLRCGVVKIGTEPTSNTEKLLSQMTVGDREALILGIRKATYGDKLEVNQWMCTNCGAVEDLEMEVADIPIVTLHDPANETTFKIPLRKGGFAQVNLATGADQIATFEKPELTQAQRETILLSRCVQSITDDKGVEHIMAAFPSLARTMSVPDRHAILNALRDKQPGPKYDKIEYTCGSCNGNVLVTVTIGNLFLDFGWV